MTRFNKYFANDFGSCRLIAYGYDVYREREVKVYLMPGDVENVGLTDGVDKWIAPVSADPFGGKGLSIQRIVRDIAAGVKVDPPVRPSLVKSRGRRALLDAPPEPPMKRERHALLDASQAPTTPSRSRRVLLA